MIKKQHKTEPTLMGTFCQILPTIIPLFTIGSIYSTNASGAEQMILKVAP